MNNVIFAIYADDNALYVIGDGVIKVIESLKEASDELFCWFVNNQVKANPDKCHLITSSSDEVSIYVENYNIKSSKCEKLLGIKIDKKLNFNNHIDEICKKPGQKLNALLKPCPLHGLVFFLSQFGYCLLVWMFHSRGKSASRKMLTNHLWQKEIHLNSIIGKG